MQLIFARKSNIVYAVDQEKVIDENFWRFNEGRATYFFENVRVRVRLNFGPNAHVRAAENWSVRVCVRATWKSVPTHSLITAIKSRCGRVIANNIAYAKFRKSLLIW